MNEALNYTTIPPKNKAYINILIILSNMIINAFILIISLYIESISFDQWLLPFAILSLVQLFVNLFTVFNLEGKLFSLSILFLIFSFVTHLGILVIFGLKINIIIPWDPLISITRESFKEACYFTVFCHSFLTFGMCLVLRKRKKNIKLFTPFKDENRELHLARRIGTVLIIIGLLPMLYIDINRVLLYITGNYLSTYDLTVNGFVVTVGRMTEIGIIMLLIGNKKNKVKAKLILLITLFYEGIIMFTGNRGRPVMYLITIFFVYYNLIKEIKFIQFIKMLIYLYISGFLLTFIGQIRVIAISFDNAFELLSKSFVEFSIFKVLAEFGITVITLGHSLVLFPETRAFQLGTNYLVSLLTIFPNIGGFLKPILDKMVYIYNWPLSIKMNLGGSYLGELYYSFGKFSYVFAMLVGMMIAFVSNQINKNLVQKRYISLTIYLILFPNLLWWVRDYFGDMVREFVWISLFIILLSKLFKNKINFTQKTSCKLDFDSNPLKCYNHT